MATNHNYQLLNLKKTPTKLSKQPEQEQNYRMESFGRFAAGTGKGENGEMVQGLRSIIGRNKIGRGILRIIEQK